MNFNIDEAMLHVVSNKTKEYLREVVSSYYNGNYRACIVSLHTVVIYDFLDKLVKLGDLYSDESAEKHIEEVKRLQEQDTKYSEIEIKILDGIKNMKLMNTIEIRQYNDLRKARNDAAHPAFNDEYELIDPTKEQALAHIRNMFDCVFTRDIVLSEKILGNFLNDIYEYYDRQPDLLKFETFILNKYYKRFNKKAKIEIFKLTWKSTFYIDDEKCHKYRQVLLETLIHLCKWDKELFLNTFRELNERLTNKISISDHNVKFDGESFWLIQSWALVKFLAENPEFFSSIPDYIKIQIENLCKDNPNLCLHAIFLYKDEAALIQGVFQYFEKLTIRTPILLHRAFLQKYELYKHSIGSLMREYISKYYANNTDSVVYGYDFDYINKIYNELLHHVLNDYSESELLSLLELVGHRTSYKDANTNHLFKLQLGRIISEKNYAVDVTRYCVL
jgi:hypothetical protein